MSVCTAGPARARVLSAGCRTTSVQSCLDRRTDNMCRSPLLLLACGLALLALASGQGKPRLGKDGRPLLNKPKVSRKESGPPANLQETNHRLGCSLDKMCIFPLMHCNFKWSMFDLQVRVSAGALQEEVVPREVRWASLFP